ncbi:hypothetical protein ACFE04_003511 [Oxalis oulophora]
MSPSPHPPPRMNITKSSSSSNSATSSATQTLPSSSSSSDARLIVRETLRISANLAVPPPPPETKTNTNTNTNSISSSSSSSSDDGQLRFICCEEIDGRRWNYVVDNNISNNNSDSLKFKKHKNNTLRAGLMSFVRSYVVPEGFPDSVTPSYVPYMKWRALKHFFGGAMGFFTTQTLLNSVGIAQKQALPGAVAINWILKDGAGRVGKMLYARQGKKFDYDLKQLRFAADLIMEMGAAVELATAAVPHLFLPLACAANVAKNVAAVTSTSTRTPVYRAFARGENLGDVTAKGECVGNIADLLGTGLSIMISKRNPSLVPTFALLSCGYIFSSYQEVKSVVLHTLNRARFSVAVDSFLKTGKVPSLQEGNMQETILTFPWLNKTTPVVLGSRFKEAFQDPAAYLATEPHFEKERYMVTYNPSKGKVYALLKDQAKSDDILKAAYHAHVLLHFIQSRNKILSQKQNDYGETNFPFTIAGIEDHIVESCRMVSASYGIFKSRSAEQGWMMSDSHLNPGRARLLTSR